MTDDTSRTPDGSDDHENTLLLRGRVSSGPERRDLPSGAEIVSVRVSVPRTPTPMTRGSKQSVDWVDCVAWGGSARRSVASWSVGETVEIRGALRRRFYRGPQGTATRLELEVLRGRRVRGRRL